MFYLHVPKYFIILLYLLYEIWTEMARLCLIFLSVRWEQPSLYYLHAKAVIKAKEDSQRLTEAISGIFKTQLENVWTVSNGIAKALF